MKLDRIIAVRNNKTVYRDGELCMKVFDATYSKADVLNEALNYASKTLGRKLSDEEVSFLVTQASEQIEKILGTPQKKEAEKQEVKKNAKYRQ